MQTIYPENDKRLQEIRTTRLSLISKGTNVEDPVLVVRLIRNANTGISYLSSPNPNDLDTGFRFFEETGALLEFVFLSSSELDAYRGSNLTVVDCNEEYIRDHYTFKINECLYNILPTFH